MTKEVTQAYADVSASALVGGDNDAGKDFTSALWVAKVTIAEEMRSVHG